MWALVLFSLSVQSYQEQSGSDPVSLELVDEYAVRCNKNGTVIVYHLSDLSVAWTYSTVGSLLQCIPAGKLKFATISTDGRLEILDLGARNTWWKAEFPTLSSLSFADGLLVVSSRDNGHVWVLDPGSRHQQIEFRTPRIAYGGAFRFSENRLIFFDKQGGIGTIEIGTGDVAWYEATATLDPLTMAVSGDVMIVCGSGSATSYSVESGSRNWQLHFGDVQVKCVNATAGYVLLALGDDSLRSYHLIVLINSGDILDASGVIPSMALATGSVQGRNSLAVFFRVPADCGTRGAQIPIDVGMPCFLPSQATLDVTVTPIVANHTVACNYVPTAPFYSEMGDLIYLDCGGELRKDILRFFQPSVDGN